MTYNIDITTISTLIWNTFQLCIFNEIKKRIICFSSPCGLCSVQICFQKINKCTKVCKTEVQAHPVTVKIFKSLVPENVWDTREHLHLKHKQDNYKHSYNKRHKHSCSPVKQLTQWNNEELYVVLPFGRLDWQLFHIAPKDWVDKAVRPC
jgi:hypothetical protein